VFWPYEFFKALAARRRDGAATPLLAGFKLTHRCNLRCRHCPFWSRPGPELSFDAAAAKLDELAGMGVRMVIFEGGEPLLWRDGDRGLRELVARARERFLSVGVTTNGTLPFDVPADVLWVSVDGLEAAHERIRGPGAFQRTMENLRASSHPRVLANMTVNRENAADTAPLVRFLAPLVKGVTIQFHYPYGGPGDPLVPTRGQRRAVCEELIRLKEEGLPVADSAPALRALADGSWRCHDHLLANVEPDGTIRTGCYVKGRGDVDCSACGFAAHCEISLAYELQPEAILAGRSIFGWPLVPDHPDRASRERGSS
jgi:MoaA/NifB/PqqE/SkfB family radical SAM enzyme